MATNSCGVNLQLPVTSSGYQRSACGPGSKLSRRFTFSETVIIALFMAVASCAGLFQGILMMVRRGGGVISSSGGGSLPRCAKHSEKLPTIANVPRLRLPSSGVMICRSRPSPRLGWRLNFMKNDQMLIFAAYSSLTSVAKREICKDLAR